MCMKIPKEIKKIKKGYVDNKIVNEIDLKEKRYLMFIDTETIGTINMIKTCLPFEIGCKIIDIQENKIVFEKSYLVRKFFNNKFIMNCTFSASKYPKYQELLKNDKRYKTYSAREISKDIEKNIQKYEIDTMVAHNGKFDFNAIGSYFEEFGIDNPFEKLDILDTMEMSKEFTMSKEYENFCLKNIDIKTSKSGVLESDFITNSGRVRTTAQAIYSCISNNPHFKEEHTGLEDIDIEYQIFMFCLKNFKSIVSVNTAPTWRDYRKVAEMVD